MFIKRITGILLSENGTRLLYRTASQIEVVATISLSASDIECLSHT